MKFSPLSPSSRNWIAGTAAAGAALASSADAGVVQITLSGEVVTDGPTFPTNTIVADLTGDGVDDLKSLSFPTYTSGLFLVFVTDTAERSFRAFYDASLYFISTTFSTMPFNQSARRNISFEDSRINGGARTEAELEFVFRNFSPTSHSIRLLRLIFDDASTTRPISVPITIPEWVDPTPALQAAAAAAAERSRLQSRLRSLRRKLRNARRLGRSAQVQRISRQVRKVRRQIRAISV
ncbi:MAG: hypothetical protein AAGC68_11835 [Verrucomicrobiota bacterium]